MDKIYKCLCLDDDQIFGEIIKKFIARIDFLELVGVYHDPIKGVLAIDKDSPDILFLDVDMPNLDGFEIIAAIEDLPKVIVISSHWERREELLAAGAARFIIKPLPNPEELAKIVKEVIDEG